MIRPGEAVFVDTGAWIALAVVIDAMHERAKAQWTSLARAGARLRTSVPVIIETFTYLDRKGSRDLALRWRLGLDKVARFEILDCTAGDVARASAYFDQKELYRLSLVDATSFVLMKRHKIRAAFAFDTHFATAGFRCLG